MNFSPILLRIVPSSQGTTRTISRPWDHRSKLVKNSRASIRNGLGTKGGTSFLNLCSSEDVPGQAYLKYKIAEYLASITPTSISDISTPSAQEEITALQAIKPHAIVTTNYDQLLELIFKEYEPIIGQKVISGSNVLVGEMFKIHGCISDPESLVFTEKDYHCCPVNHRINSIGYNL